ncbi:MAG TPA: hypothetical protein VMU22_05440 [Rhizomicrobium sp.]|nr:hypothetical protein [Rhizomicrobium sp.]
MKVRVWALAGAAMLVAGAALADDPMANVYGNTITTKDHATGATATLLFNQDMSYTAKGTGPNGQPVGYSGTWTLKDGGKTICLTPNVPAGTPNAPPASCSPYSPHNVGDSWTVTTDGNQTFDVTLTAGR